MKTLREMARYIIEGIVALLISILVLFGAYSMLYDNIIANIFGFVLVTITIYLADKKSNKFLELMEKIYSDD